jgi:SAM-dependent methyltransferase
MESVLSDEMIVAKEKQRKTWAAGNYAQIGATLQIVGETLAEALDIHAGRRVLDIAAGNGNFSLAAARRYGRVTSTDIVPALLEKGRIRALADGFDIDFRIADAEELPFEDASFEIVGSVFGAMFAPRQGRCAREMLRVTRPGGRIGLANWTPDGFIGALFEIIGRYVPDPRPSAALWGTAEHIEKLFGAEAAWIDIQPRHFQFNYVTTRAWLDNFREIYGPLRKVFDVLDDKQQRDLDADLLDLLNLRNIAVDGSMVVPGEYLQIIITR